MKKALSPLILRHGHIKKPRSGSDDRKTENHTQENHEKSNYLALSYIVRAAKRIGGVFASFFLQHKKGGSKASKDQVHFSSTQYQAGESPYSLSGSTVQGSRKSSGSIRSSSDAFPEFDTAQAGSSLTFEEIYKATGNFSPANKLGEGGFGTVYKGKLKNGLLFAIKRAKRETYDQSLSADQFKNEILALSKIEHHGLVRFYGYLEHGDEHLIIVEYVGNGTLREHLDGSRGKELEIGERLDIAIDVAHAITYLHTYTDPPIIHRDIKSSNILITEKLKAKVADFGFARLGGDDPGATHISTQIKGTAGYLDPEYLRTYQLTEKSDVYSFGVLLVEMITGRHPIESKRSLSERITIKWALRRLKDGEVIVAMDPRLRRSAASIKAVENVLKLARQCLAPSRLSRPSMRKCAQILWEIRKEFRENTIVANSASTSFPSDNAVDRDGRTSRQHNVFGIKDNDSLMFVSA